MTEHPHQPSLFPNLISLVFFVVIMAGMFFGFTRIYPLYVLQWQQDHPDPTPPVVDVPAQIAPFVRGTLSGIEAAQLASVRSNEPLNINQIKGYQHGMRTALLASKDWYDLDRQLFRVRGIELGMDASLITSRTTQERGQLEYQLNLIRQIQIAFNTDLEDLLESNDSSRARVLQSYLDNLQELSTEAEVELRNMERIINESQAQIQTAQETSESFSDSFDATSEAFVSNIDRNLGPYLEARRDAEEARVRGKATQDIYNQLNPLYQQLEQVIQAITANYEALEAGIRVTPTPGVNLPIFQEN